MCLGGCKVNKNNLTKLHKQTVITWFVRYLGSVIHNDDRAIRWVGTHVHSRAISESAEK